MKKWIIATRPWSFPVSSMSVMVTAAYLYWRGWEINWWLTLWALVGIIIFHAAGNLISDYFDYKKGIDAADTYGSKTLTDGILTPKQVLVFGIITLVIAAINGLGIMLCTGWQLLIFGGIGALLTLLYPWMKSHAMGDLDIFLEYGIVPALGTAFTITCGNLSGALYADALWATLCFVTITIAVLHANNTRDTFTDKRAGIRTFAMQIGKENSVTMYVIEVMLPCIWVVSGCIMGRMPWFALPVLFTLIPAFKNSKTMVRFMSDDQAINFLDQATSMQQLLNGAILTVTLIAARLLSPYLPWIA